MKNYSIYLFYIYVMEKCSIYFYILTWVFLQQLWAVQHISLGDVGGSSCFAQFLQ